MATHYIGMAGLHGYLPSTCEVFDSQAAAAESLAATHDLGKRRAAALKRDGYLELNLRRDGNEYCEIEPCDCATPEVHSDSGFGSGA